MESLCAEPEKSGIISVYVCGVRLHICYKRRRSIFEKEKRYHQTLIGIHRDDILFELNENPVCEVASQGQKRSFVLALKLGLAQIIYEKSGQYPILLLDDVFSELDDFRKRQLIEKLPRDMQIFITTTERLNINWNREVRFYDIEKGRIKEVLK